MNMLNKIYVKIKNFIKENYKILIFYVLLLFLVTYKLPYYIYTGGGVMETSDKVKIENSYSVSGKFNFAYVSERNATIPMYLLALINDKWDIEKQSSYKYTDEETAADIAFRNKLDLDSANSNAVYNAYRLANKTIALTSSKNYIIYLTEQNKSILKVGDIIIGIDNQEIKSLADIRTVIDLKNIGNIVKVKVKRNDKELNVDASVYLENDSKMIGIGVQTLNTYETDPKVTFNFNNNESGPSGGLMLTLTIYNYLTETDLTNGLNIVGTGTIDNNGNIGTIGGVKYKLAGAVKNKADIFLVPNEENYDECIKLKEKYNYDIEIIGVDTIEDAINKLEEKQ